MPQGRVIDVGELFFEKPTSPKYDVDCRNPVLSTFEIRLTFNK